MKRSIILANFLVWSCLIWGQQDPQVSLYLRNPIQFNSAHTGTDGTLRVTAISRLQWTGWEGAPRTHFFSVHAPVFRQRMGAGLTVMSDKSGGRSQSEIKMHGAYHLPVFGPGIHMSTGLSLGLQTDGFAFQDLLARHPDDALLGAPYSQSSISAGFGFLAYAESWFVGYAMPQLFEHDLGDQSPVGLALQHHYVTGGYIHALNTTMDLRVSGLLKAVADAPMTVDVNVECWFLDVISVGIMNRWKEGMGVQASYRFKDGWRFHYAVDFPLNGLMTRSFGSHEIGLAWDYGKKPDAFKSPRYF